MVPYLCNAIAHPININRLPYAPKGLTEFYNCVGARIIKAQIVSVTDPDSR
jgi:hypothetical protein